MKFDAIIVGGGAAGLTAAAHLTKDGHKILLLEKEAQCGGLVTSFQRDGFTFDGGIRALENAGVLFPMLKKLGIDLPFVENKVSLGIEDQVIHIEGDESIHNYGDLLKAYYPESIDDINAIIADIEEITHMMDIQYGIDNPLFLDIKEDRDYFIKEVFPWMLKYALTFSKVGKKNQPVIPYLENFTDNQALIDIITQHFFRATPAFFALSYFKLYQEYIYPKNSTGDFSQKLVEVIQAQGGEIRTGTTVTAIDLDQQTAKTSDGQLFKYNFLIWAADQKTLYRMVDEPALKDPKTRAAVQEKKAFLAKKNGNDSVLTLYLTVDLDKTYFGKISNAHFFYTPSRVGLSKAGEAPIDGSWEETASWLEKFYALTTYEISIPALRNSAMAPAGKTGLIISTLFDFTLTKYIDDQGWTNAFQNHLKTQMIQTLEASVYPHLSEAVIDSFISTPLTLQNRSGNTEGAITGWSFKNDPMPAESRLIKISKSVQTPLPGVFQAGQWTYSPSGFPVALITGKLAADAIHKRLK
jgi:phytoene dehydrogenase-like protein